MPVNTPAIPAQFIAAPAERTFYGDSRTRKHFLDRLDYDFDFAIYLDGNDSISELDAVVEDGTVTVDGEQFSGKKAKVWIGGGAEGETAIVNITVATANGRVKEVFLRLRIEPQPADPPQPPDPASFYELRWREEWDVDETYSLNDVVSYDDSSWRALRGSRGIVPVEGSIYWTMVARKAGAEELMSFPTRAAFAAATIGADDPDVVEIVGDDTIDDGNGLIFKRNVGEPAVSADEKVQSADGQWWRAIPYNPLASKSFGAPAISRRLRSYLDEEISVLDFLAKNDGAELLPGQQGGSFTGTDNSGPFQEAADFAASQHKPVRVPPGKYRFADLSGTDNIICDGEYHVFHAQGAEFLLDDLGPLVPASWLFASTSTTDRRAKEKFALLGGTIRGRWSHLDLSAWDGDTGRKGIGVFGFAEAIVRGVDAYDIRGQLINSFSCDAASVTHNRFERIARACIRFNDTPDQDISHNVFKWVDDDVIACQSHVGGGVTSPNQIRSRVVIIGNKFFQCESILISEARELIVALNVLTLSKAAAIVVGNNLTPYAMLVALNTVTMTTTRIDNDGVALNEADDGNVGIALSGVKSSGASSAAIPGQSDGTAIVDPRGKDINGDWFTQNSDGLTQSLGPGFGLHVHHNAVHLPQLPGAVYSDWGYGQMFTYKGWRDPAVSETKLAKHGISVGHDCRGVAVTVNTVSGHRAGAAVFFAFQNSPDVNRTFRDILVADTISRDNRRGISSDREAAGSDVPVGITSQNNTWDCDPHLKSPRRSAIKDGTWQSGTTDLDMVAGIAMKGMKGLIVRGDRFANCIKPIHASVADPHTVADIHGCLAICDPAASGFSTSNKGIGEVPAGRLWTHKIVHCDATDAVNFELLKNLCPTQASAMPVSGTFVARHFVRNTDPTSIIKGWLRMTTGSAHVAGVDWVTIFRSDLGTAAVTATADGTGTGVIPDWATHVTVTSSAATQQVALPSGTAANRGRPPLLIWVGANGYELIALGGTPTINNVNVGPGFAQADIGANTLSRLTLTAPNAWLLENLSHLGVVNAAIVPDND